MSFKSLDLQVSIPRTPEQSAAQSHLAHRPVLDQNRLAAAAAEQTTQLRHKNAAADDVSGPNIRDRSGQGGGQAGGRDKRSGGGPAGTADERHEAGGDHPFKGRHIDISL